MRYRPELDGLRGVAVLLVMQAHSGIPWNNGGTVGVTIFFVLSGYLITSILTRELADTGRIALGAFYRRRVRRLAPALGLMLAAVAAVLSVQGQALGPVVAAGTYLANFAKAAHFSMYPLDHTWSLALEEQFYLLWPLLLPWVLRTRRPVVWLLVAAAASSVVRSIIWVWAGDFNRSMFGPDTRADALLVGCALALSAHRFTRVPAVLRVAAAGALAGAVVFDYYGIKSMPAVVLAAAVLIVWAGQSVALRRALSVRLLVWVGRISYGLYLWHYPIAELLPVENVWVKVPTVFAASFALAALSWYLVERPILKRWAKPRQSALVGA